MYVYGGKTSSVAQCFVRHCFEFLLEPPRKLSYSGFPISCFDTWKTLTFQVQKESIEMAADSQTVIDKSLRSVFGKLINSTSSIFYFNCLCYVLVGNIPYDVTEEKLKDIFSEAGPVVSFKYAFLYCVTFPIN